MTLDHANDLLPFDGGDTAHPFAELATDVMPSYGSLMRPRAVPPPQWLAVAAQQADACRNHGSDTPLTLTTGRH